LRPDASSGMVMGRIFSARNNINFFSPLKPDPARKMLRSTRSVLQEEEGGSRRRQCCAADGGSPHSRHVGGKGRRPDVTSRWPVHQSWGMLR
jgi:hypothetical protein